MMSYAASPLAMLQSFREKGQLLKQMTRRDIASRYRGSALGILWSFVMPLMMLAVYSFVFGVVFNARFGTEESSDLPTASFALTLFCGLIIHGLWAECLTRAPALIVQHASYVKKVVFPLEILPVMLLGSSLFHFAMSLIVLLAGLAYTMQGLPLTIFWLPVILLPMLMLLLGINWILASLGVYLRDIGQLTGLLSTLLLFLSPIFYPLERLPVAYQPLLMLNPLTPFIEMSRDALIAGTAPDILLLGIFTIIGGFTMCIGFWWFQKTRKGFADIM